MTELQDAWHLYSSGDLRGSRRILETCLQQFPRDAQAHFLLGLVEIDEGFSARGLKRIEERAAAYTPAAPVCERLGEIRFKQGEYARAEAWLRRALEQDPSRAGAWAKLGNALRMLDRADESERAFRRSIDLAPAEEDGYVGLAFLYLAAHRNEDAAAVMLDLARLADSRAEPLEKVMAFLEDLRRPDLALRIGRRLLEFATGDAALLARVGRLEEQLGAFEDAALCYRQALAADPDTDVAYLGLSVVRQFDSDDHPDVRLIRRSLDRDGLARSARVCAHFALGKILDDCGRYDEAFEHLSEANSLRSAARRFDLTTYRENMTRIRTLFSAERLRRLQVCPPGRPVPVFVVGMMRSGTTLVERMLDSHSQVHGAGELHLIEQMAGSLGITATDAEPSSARDIDLNPERLTPLARQYLDSLGGLSKGESVVVDKNPGNFAYLGLLALLFPQAKFIHCTRDPLDTCLSIFFQNFAHEAHAWAYDLDAIAEVYSEYHASMSHWHEVLSGRIFEASYAALASEPEPVIRSMLDFLELPFEAACLEFHANPAAVGTASVWQARQPLYTKSVGRWRHYAAQLAPLRKRLLAAGVPVDASQARA